MKKIVVFASGSGTNAENIIVHFNKKRSGKCSWRIFEQPECQSIGKGKKIHYSHCCFL